MKTARRIVAMMLAVLLVSVMFIGCGQEAAPVDDAAPAVSETAVIIDEEVVEEAPVVEEVAIVEEAPVVEEVASAGTADSDATMDLMLYMIETSGWHTVNSKETVTVTPAGGTFTFSFDTDHITLSNVGSMYIKDKNVNMELTSKSIFSSVSIALEKYSINGVEFDTLNKDASGNLIYEEGIASRGVFDYCFVNQWWTDGLKLSNCEIPEFRSSYAFNGTELYTDKLNHFELTFSIKPIDAANILDEAETRRELKYVYLNKSGVSMLIGETVNLSCHAEPKVCERYERDWNSMISWSSSDPSVATVSGGVVTAVGEGIAVITARYYDHTASCAIVSVDPMAAVSKVKLYGCFGGLYGESSEIAEIYNLSAGQTYSFTIVDQDMYDWQGISQAGNGWNLTRIATLYLKDVDVAEGNSSTTTFKNATVSVNGVYINGNAVDVNANEYTSGEQFDVPFINAYEDYCGVTDDYFNEETDWGGDFIVLVDENGKEYGTYWDGTANTLEVEVTIESVN